MTEEFVTREEFEELNAFAERTCQILDELLSILMYYERWPDNEITTEISGIRDELTKPLD